LRWRLDVRWWFHGCVRVPPNVKSLLGTIYDSTAALTHGVNAGVAFKVSDRAELTAQVGLRHVSGLAASPRSTTTARV
jgi:hypothetical protein